jgi:hypothetical protein
VKECQSVEKSLAFSGAAVPGRVSVAGPEGRPFGELQFGEDYAIVFLGRGMVFLESPHNGKTPEIGRSPPGCIS